MDIVCEHAGNYSTYVYIYRSIDIYNTYTYKSSVCVCVMMWVLVGMVVELVGCHISQHLASQVSMLGLSLRKPDHTNSIVTWPSSPWWAPWQKGWPLAS